MKKILFMLLILASAFISSCGGSGSNNESDIITNDTKAAETDSLPDESAEVDRQLELCDCEAPAELGNKMLDLMEEYRSFSNEPNVILSIYKPGSFLWSGQTGINDITANSPIPEHVLSRVGSETKPFTAVLTMMLVENGKLNLDTDTVGKFFPEYAKWTDVTIRQLLGHQSGIPDYLGKNDFLMFVFMNQDKVFTPQELLEYVRNDDLKFGPNGEGLYTDSNWILLGMIIEKVTGGTYKDFLEKQILIPFGLTNSFLCTDKTPIDGLLHGYMDVYQMDKSNQITPFLQGKLIDNRLLDVSYMFDSSVGWSAAGLITDNADLLKFWSGLFSGKILSKTSLDEMMKFQKVVVMGVTREFGLGIGKRLSPAGDTFGHGGLFIGYSADTYAIPERGLYYSAMTGSYPDQGWYFMDKIFGILDKGLETAEKTTCTVDETMFETHNSPEYADFRFIGRINKAGSTDAVDGSGFFKLQLKDKFYYPYVYGRSAFRLTAGSGDFIQISAIGFHDKNTPKLKTMIINANVDALAAMKNGGTETVSVTDYAQNIFSFTIDTDLDENQIPVKMCYSGFGEPSEDSKVHYCLADNTDFSDGEIIKGYGTFKMNYDPEAVKQFFVSANIPECYCLDDSGLWNSCE